MNSLASSCTSPTSRTTRRPSPPAIGVWGSFAARTIALAMVLILTTVGTADAQYTSPAQEVPTQSASAPLAPALSALTFNNVNCIGYWSDLPAWNYLDMTPNDQGVCPVRGMFTAANGYFPVWGDQPSVANNYGKVLVRQDGECSFLVDTGPNWDFQVPCKAHDYCYDLRKASFSGTVSDSDCDWLMLDLMYADCDDRNPVAEAACKDLADHAFAVVRAPSVVTNPNPGVVEIRSRQTGKCADIEGPSVNDGVPIQQWTCVGVSNQRFKIYPAPNAAGFFHIKPTHSNKCARALNDPVQWSCSNTWNSQRHRIQGALNQDQFSLRSRTNTSECWKVPTSWNNGTDLTNPWCNDTNSWYLWRIVDV